MKKIRDLFQFEEEKEYRIRLMPNIYDVQNSLIEARMCDKKNTRIMSKHYFCYVLINEEVKICHLPRAIFDKLYYVSNGNLSTNDSGLILGDSKVQCYYIEDDDIISFNHKDMKLISKTLNGNKVDLKYDVKICVEPYDVFGVRNGYEVIFTMKRFTNEKFNYKTYINISLNKNAEPLYRDGDEQSKILYMYQNLRKLEDTVDDYLTEVKKSNENLLINNEINEYKFGKLGSNAKQN